MKTMPIVFQYSSENATLRGRQSKKFETPECSCLSPSSSLSFIASGPQPPPPPPLCMNSTSCMTLPLPHRWCGNQCCCISPPTSPCSYCCHCVAEAVPATAPSLSLCHRVHATQAHWQPMNRSQAHPTSP